MLGSIVPENAFDRLGREMYYDIVITEARLKRVRGSSSRPLSLAALEADRARLSCALRRPWDAMCVGYAGDVEGRGNE